MSPEIQELISENVHLLVVALVAVLWIFKRPFGVVIEKVFPGAIRWFVKKKLDIDLPPAPDINTAEIGKEVEKIVNNPSFAKEQKIRTWLIDPLGMLYDAKLYKEWIIYEAARAKKEQAKLTFNMILVERADKRFQQAWQDAVAHIIANNGVFVQIVFPHTPKNGVDELYIALESYIGDQKAHCVLIRREGRTEGDQRDAKMEKPKKSKKEQNE